MRLAVDEYNDTLEEIDLVSNICVYGKGAFHSKFGCSSGLGTGSWLCRLEPYTSLNYLTSDCKRDQRVNIDF